ncbi:MAG: sodium:solute symporter family protein [Acidobacteria bacterium]|nr:sodium:solute symporter family protein [Acidobacteriota bacterium]
MTYLLILIGYSLLMIALGVFWSRRVAASSDFFVAGRGLSAGLIFSTLLAANIGAGSTVGATGLGYRDGLSAWWWVGSAGIGSLILAFTVGPKIWRIARDNDLFTVGDYLEFRYDRSVRGLVALLLWIGSLAILAGQLIAIAWVLNVTMDVSKPIGCLIGAVVVTIYFASGGLFGAARVNALQLVVKLVGFGLALTYLLKFNQAMNSMFYPPTGSAEKLETMKSFTGIGASGILRYLALLVPSFIISPGLLQKIFGARDEKAVRTGVALNAICLLLFAFVPALMGMIAFYNFPDLPNRELALPMLMTKSLPVWLGGLLLGAIFAAEVSTADAVLFMLSTSLSKDLYKAFIRPEADDKQLLKVAKLTAVACGGLGALLAIILRDVITALTIFYTLLSSAPLLPLIAGLYSKRISARAVIPAMLVSVIGTFALDYLTAGKGFSAIPSLIYGVGAGAVVMWLLSLTGPKK